MLGSLVALAGVITFIRGLPTGVELRPGKTDPKHNLVYLIRQESLGCGVIFLALDVVLTLADRPFLIPGIVLLISPTLIKAIISWYHAHRGDSESK
jgi:hypothetical protein